MKKYRLIAALVLLALTLSHAALAAGSFNKYPIDVDALKALEASDTFSVRITKKTVTDGANQSADFINPDILTLTVELFEEDAMPLESEVTGMVVLVVCYDDQHNAAPLLGTNVILLGTAKREISTQTSESIRLTRNQPYQVTMPCSHSGFTGARAIVAEITTSDGQTLVNPLVAEWQELALGSPTHILD